MEIMGKSASLGMLMVLSVGCKKLFGGRGISEWGKRFAKI